MSPKTPLAPRRPPKQKSPADIDAWVNQDTNIQTDKETSQSVNSKTLTSSPEKPRRRGEVMRKRTGSIKRRITSYLDAEIAERLLILAVREGTDASAQMEAAVRLYLTTKS